MGLASLRSGVLDMAKPLSNLLVEYEGDWIKMDRLMSYMAGGAFNRGIKRDIAKGQRDFLTKMKSNLVAGLLSGGSKIGAAFADHSSGYRDGGKGIGIKSGNYLVALANSQVKQKGYVVTLLMSKGDISYKPDPDGLTIGQYALIFEQGAPKRPNPQPARPLWRSTYNYMGGDKGVLQNMQGAVGKRLNRMGIHIKVNTQKYQK